MSPLRIAIVATHPIQYYGPWFKRLAQRCDLTVYYAHRQSPDGQAAAGFRTPFDWDVPLLEGYAHRFLVNVSDRPGLERFDGCNTPEIDGLLRSGRFDAVVLLGWNRLTYLQAGLATLRAGAPLFVRLDSQLRTRRSRIKRVLKYPLYSATLPWAADYLSPGQRADDYLRHYGVPSAHVHRLAHMVDTGRFAASAEAARKNGGVQELRRRHGVHDDGFVFIFVGKLTSKKRPLALIDALARLGGRAHAWIVGDGPLAASVDAKIKALNVSATRMGFVNQTQLPTYYAAADCLVLPSSGDETWGLVVNEAFACGLPAIVSDDAGCAPDLIDEGATGWTVRHVSAETLSSAMALAAREARALPRAALEAKSQASSFEVGADQLIGAVSAVKDRRSRNRRERELAADARRGLRQQ